MEWPTVLPLPTREGFNRQYRTKMRRTKMDDGSTFARRMFPYHAYDLKLTFRFTASQMAIFDAFLRYDCNYGTAWFNLQVRKGAAKIKVKLTSDAPTCTPVGLDWDVTLTLFTLDDMTGKAATSPNLAELQQWPSDIPLPLKEEYSIQMSNLFTEDNFDNGGLPNARSRFTYKETVFQANWLLSAAERDRFFAFFRYQLLDGYLPVAMRFYNGRGASTLKCTFQEFPSETSQGAAFKISSKMSTFDAPVMPLAEYRLQVPVS